ncbi:unnamed protein product [Meloidogyne enterolobii]|uniref:Uncharacterized protein n=1 Tax=Meloidogyne enterolobii TaxID=390850 RepID=A0ACB0Y5A8_MELEN
MKALAVILLSLPPLAIPTYNILLSIHNNNNQLLLPLIYNKISGIVLFAMIKFLDIIMVF